MTKRRLSHTQVVKLALPVMLSQIAIAVTGVVDTAVMGLTGDKVDLAAVGIATVTFSFLYWGFGFLRMSTTGLVAQAIGAERPKDARKVFQQAILLGACFGLMLLGLAPFLVGIIFSPFGAETDVVDLAQQYFSLRIWGAPALLVTYALSGWLLGTGRTGALLAFQIVMNLVNVILDLWFVLGLGWGLSGIAIGTVIAEWVAVLFGLCLVARSLKPETNLMDWASLKTVFRANRDILIRTLALLFCFAWFTRSGASQGTAALAGNEILLQFITVSMFVLDGIAFIAEKEVGEAYGARDRRRIKRAMMVTSRLALTFGAFISLSYFLIGPPILNALIADTEARDVALAYMPYCALVPLIGVPAWQLDGFFLGATQGRAIRLAGLFMAAAYLVCDSVLRPFYGNSGVWIALVLMYVFRAMGLAVFMPQLLGHREEASPTRH